MAASDVAGDSVERVSYNLLPHKGQLAMLMLARIAEPLAATSIQSCMFFQLRHFDPSASDATIATQAGLLVSSKTAAHVCTGILWGRLADSEYGGRKLVLVTGLLACGVGILGYGFSRSFASALAWQLVDGLLNSSIPMIRCMTAELYLEKRYRARALTLLPLSACAGMFLGPILGGFLAFKSQRSALDGHLSTFPFLVPSIIIASYSITTAIMAFLLLEERLEGARTDGKSLYDVLIDTIIAFLHRMPRRSTQNPNESEPLLTGDRMVKVPQVSSTAPVDSSSPDEMIPQRRQTLPFHRMWTNNVVNTMLATFIIAGHLGTFTTLWPIFLSAPSQPSDSRGSPFRFSGGLAMNPRQVAIVMSLLGSLGVLLQAMIYPTLNDKFGAIRIWRSALLFFPLAYFAAPFSALATQTSSDPTAMTIGGALMWVVVIFVLLTFIAGRTGVTPATTFLINECTPHPSARGTIHTTGTIVSNLGRSVFPAIILPVFGYGLKIGVTGLGFWCLAGLAVLACAIRGRITEGSNGQDVAL